MWNHDLVARLHRLHPAIEISGSLPTWLLRCCDTCLTMAELLWRLCDVLLPAPGLDAVSQARLYTGHNFNAPALYSVWLHESGDTRSYLGDYSRDCITRGCRRTQDGHSVCSKGSKGSKGFPCPCLCPCRSQPRSLRDIMDPVLSREEFNGRAVRQAVSTISRRVLGSKHVFSADLPEAMLFLSPVRLVSKR